MEQKYTDDTFLAKWLNKDLSEEERIAFEKTTAFKDYSKIIKKMERFEAPVFNESAVLEKIKNKTAAKQKVRRLIPNWAISVAASVALVFGIFHFMNNDTVYETSFGEQLAVVLPDGSTVQLNAKSTLSFDAEEWKEGTRNLKLDGEGYFKVQKGSKFTVETTSGAVSVLGTQFNVKHAKDYFEVKCFEGKVSVVNKTDSAILTAGIGYRKIIGNSSEETRFETSGPSWVSGETSFVEVPLKHVLEELKKQYQVNIDINNIDVNQLFTGSFTNKNKEVALQTICAPMQLNFKIKNEKTITLSKK